MGGIFFVIAVALILLLGIVIHATAQVTWINWGKEYAKIDQGDAKSLLVKVTILFFGSALLLGGLRTFVILFCATFLSKSIHSMLVKKMLRARYCDFIARLKHGLLINRFSYDLDQVDKRIPDFMSYFYTLVVLTMSDIILTVVGANNILAVIPCLIYIIFCVFLWIYFMKAKREVYRLFLISKSPLSSLARQIIQGKYLIVSLSQSNNFEKKLSIALSDYMKNNMAWNGLNAWFNIRVAIANLVLVLIPISCYILYSLRNGEVDPSKLVLFFLKAVSMSNNFRLSLIEISNCETEYISLERCISFETIGEEEGYKELDRQEIQSRKTGYKEAINNKNKFDINKIEFIQVKAKYPTRSILALNGVDLFVNRGERIGIAGRTGSGKSTILKLLWGDIEKVEGSIILSDTPIIEIKPYSLRQNISFLSSTPILFEGSLRENLFPGKEFINKEEEEIAIGHLKGMGFKAEHISLDKKIPWNGGDLEIIDQHIVCLARALCAQTPVLVFDEVFSFLENKYRVSIMEYLAPLLKDKILIEVAHQIENMLEFNRIYIMNEGKILESGPPQELMKKADSELMKFLGKTIPASRLSH